MTTTVDQKVLKWTMPIILRPMGNARLHHMAYARITKKLNELSRFYARMNSTSATRTVPAKVTMTRVFVSHRQSPKTGRKVASRAWDRDNLIRSFKTVQDAIATEWGVHDGDKRWIWDWQQRVGEEDGVEVVIERQ